MSEMSDEQELQVCDTHLLIRCSVLPCDTWQVRQVLSQGSGMEVLSQRFNISIKRADIGTLSGLNWLNDEVCPCLLMLSQCTTDTSLLQVINFYMSLIVERGQSASSVCHVHAMSSFFYPKLRDVGYSGVRRWTKKVRWQLLTVIAHGNMWQAVWRLVPCVYLC